MTRFRATGALVAALLLAVGAGAMALPASATTKAAEKSAKPDPVAALCNAVDAPMADALAALALEGQPGKAVHSRLVGLGSAANDAGRHECALALFLAAERALPGDVEHAVRLAWLERYLGQPESAAARVVYIAGKDLKLLDGEDEWLDRLVYALPEGSPARVALLRALFDAHWDTLPSPASEHWFELAEAHLADDDIAGARAAIARITSASVIARLRIDRRFDALVDRDSPRFDLRRAAEAELVSLRARSARAPRLLGTRIAILATLLELGRAGDVLAEADAIEALVAAAPADAPPFDDADEMIWVRNERTIALRRLGRLDEAVAALDAASRMPEQGGINVSQSLNLANFLNRLGRASQAREALARVGTSLSGYGRMVQMQEEMLAALLDGDRASAGVALAYLVEHADDAPAIARGALVDMDRPDQAAARLIADLAAPATRAEALLDLQDFKRPDPLPADIERLARWERLLARADVRAVIDQVGRREHFDVHRRGGMD